MTLAELKAKATELGLTPDDVRQHGPLTKKTTWETAIAIGRKSDTVDIAVTVNQSESSEVKPGDDSVQNQATVEPTPVKLESVATTVNQNRPGEGWWHKTKKTSTLDDAAIEIDGEMVAASEVVNPDNLPTLAETDPRFEAWQPWMTPGATFTTGRQSYTILYFDPCGNCNAKGTDNRWHSFRLETIVNSIVPISFTSSEPIPTIEPEVEMNGWHRWDEKLQVWIKEDPEETLKDCYQPESESYRQQLLKRMKPYVGVCVQSKDFEQLKNEPLDESTAAVYLGLLEESERILTEAIAS